MINEAYALDIGRKIKAQARQAMKDGDYVGRSEEHTSELQSPMSKQTLRAAILP